MKNIFTLKKISLFVAFLIPLLCFLVTSLFHEGCSDSSVFRYMGWRISNGSLPYLEAWDHKGPLISFFNALGFYLFKSVIGVAFIYLLIWWATILFAYKALKFFVSSKEASIAICGFIILSSWGLTGGAFQNNVEILAVFINAVILYLYTKTKSLWGVFGIGIGIGFLVFVKPNLLALGGAIALGGWAFNAYKTKNYTHLISQYLILLIGIIFTLFLVSFYFWTQGLLYEMWDATLFFNLLEYKQGTVSHINFWTNFFFNYKVVLREMGHFILILPLAYLGLKTLSKQKNYKTLIFFGTWVIIELLLLFIVKSFYQHYLINIYLPLCVLIGVVVDSYPLQKNAKALLIWGVLFMCCLHASYRFAYWTRALMITNQKRDDLYALVNDKTKTSKHVAVWGMLSTSEVLTKCELLTSQQYFYHETVYLFGNQKRKKKLEDEFLVSLKDEKTSILLLGSPQEKMIKRFKHNSDLVDELRKWSVVYEERNLFILEKI